MAQKLEGHGTTLRYIAGQHKAWSGRTSFTWRTSRTDGTWATLEDAVAKITAMVEAGDTYVPQYSGKPSKYLGEFEAAKLARDLTRSAVTDHEANYTGWQRFWLCCSSNGHVHNRNCSSFRPTTRIALVPSLSAASIEACVAVLGPSLCSKCFPAAPVEWQDNAKVPSSVADVLFNQGEAAFHVALEAHRAKAAAKAAKS